MPNVNYTDRHEELTTSIIFKEDNCPFTGQSILWSESVAECAPESTELLADRNTRNLPSGLDNIDMFHMQSALNTSILSCKEFFFKLYNLTYSMVSS